MGNMSSKMKNVSPNWTKCRQIYPKCRKIGLECRQIFPKCPKSWPEWGKIELNVVNLAKYCQIYPKCRLIVVKYTQNVVKSGYDVVKFDQMSSIMVKCRQFGSKCRQIEPKSR